MEQKASIINRLKDMGYLVTEDNGIYFIVLRAGNGVSFGIHYSDLELIQYSGNMVDRVVSDINRLIINWNIEKSPLDTTRQIITEDFIPHIEKCFDIKLFDHQIQYLLGKGNLKLGRRTGKTLAYCIALGLSEGPPLSLSKPEKFSDEWSLPHHHTYSRTFFICEFVRVREELKKYGFRVRDVQP